jgi:hypothetical protein
MEDNLLLRPPNIERLIGFVSLIAEEGLFLLGFYQRGIGIQSSLPLRMALLERSHKVPVRLPQPLKMLVGGGDEGLPLLPFLFLLRIMEGLLFAIPRRMEGLRIPARIRRIFCYPITRFSVA